MSVRVFVGSKIMKSLETRQTDHFNINPGVVLELPLESSSLSAYSTTRLHFRFGRLCIAHQNSVMQSDLGNDLGIRLKF